MWPSKVQEESRSTAHAVPYKYGEQRHSGLYMHMMDDSTLHCKVLDMLMPINVPLYQPLCMNDPEFISLC